MATTETVTVLFTDMVGSTQLVSQLAPQAADELRRTHFSALRQALAAHDGTEVKSLGDGLMAVFSSPSAAVACAVTMQQLVEQENRRSRQGVGLRVAMSVGEVTTEEADYFGEPVVEAARLCAQCDGGRILATEAVRILSGRRSPYPFTVLGERDLKGLPAPVSVLEVQWEPAVDMAEAPLPERLEPTGTEGLFGFVGRVRELEELNDEVKSAIEGSRRTAFVSGEPGIGKSTVCRQLAQRAHAQGLCVLYGRCDEDLPLSYQPFVEALNHLVIHANEELLNEHVLAHGGALLGLAPALAVRVPGTPSMQGGDPDSERFRLFSAVVGLLSLVAERSGLLMVLDDLHWADKASLQLLRHIAGAGQLRRTMILATYRDSELSAGSLLSDTLASLRREVDATRIDLQGLEDFEIVQMMERVAGHEMDSDGVDLAHAVRRETDGNPFFTTEMLRHLAEIGLVYQNETGRWVASEDLYVEGLPQSVREVVGQRVDRLGDDARRVLSNAAVIGRDFDIGLLSTVSEVHEDRILDIVDRAAQAGVLAEVEGVVDRYTFAHALMQHTLYEDLGTSRRARVHRRIAEALEDLYNGSPDGHAGELARHFLAATRTADTMKALLYTKMAGDQALAQLAPADALGWFNQSLELYAQLPLDEQMHCDLLTGLGTAQRLVGDPAHRETLLQAADVATQLSDNQRLVAAVLANSRGGVSVTGQVDYERLTPLERALESVGDADSPERALLLATLAAELTYSEDLDKRSIATAESLEMARRLGDPPTLLRVTSLAYQDFYLPHSVEDRLSCFAEAVRIAETLRDPVAAFRAHYARAVACLQDCRGAELDAHLAECLTLAERIDQPHESWSTAIVRSTRALQLGRLGEAEELANAAMALGSESVPESMTTFGAQLLEILRVAGRWEELAQMGELMAAAADENPGVPALRAVLARTYADLSRDEDALATIRDDIRDLFNGFPYDVVWLSGMVVLAETCIRLGQWDACELLYEKLLPWRDQGATVTATWVGPVALHLATLSTVLGRYDDAEEQFTLALVLCERLGAPYWTARTEIELASMLGRRSDWVDPRGDELLEHATRLANDHGFGGLLPRIAEVGRTAP